MTSRRLLTVSPDHDPLWVRLYVRQIGEQWAAMLLADEEAPPEPGALKGLAFFGGNPRGSGTRSQGVSRMCGAGELTHGACRA